MAEKPLLDGHGEEKLDIDATAEDHQAFVDSTDKERGLDSATVEKRRLQFGYNELVEEEVNPFLKFLTYFWGPMPVMIWLAIIVELVKAASTGDGWEDFAVLMVLQLVNGVVGYIEEKNAGNAIAALKEQLAPQCRVCRDGKWQSMPSRELVPGDLLELVIGDIIPADGILLDGEPIQVDQAALTGESLPVTIYPGKSVKMGSAVKRGEIKCVVVATGSNTFFGKAADMLNIEDTQGRFQKILFKITLALLALSLLLTSIIFIKLMVVKEPESHKQSKFLRSLSVVIVLLVASIPIAMQVVCTSTMAVGSRRLSQRKVIVARLSAIEELAGMTILCSDKTGTLTQNNLSLREPVIMGDMDENEIKFFSALSAKRELGNQDPIDRCITLSVPEDERDRLRQFKEVKFVPFNPTDKRTESTVEAPDGAIFKVSKGAPQVILRMAHNSEEIRERVENAVQELADRGFRALGVAISYTGVDEPTKWEFQGVLSLFDPPRVDTKHTIREAVLMGIDVKMVTGDQTAIAKETCRELGMGTNILNTDTLNDEKVHGGRLDEIILNSNGFAEVMPEHKFQIVDSLRKQGFVTGMTGDGVNDAPALKRADIGIAVEGATDAAKAAADIVLTLPGLSVIIDAINRSRKIFQRMRNYSIYRIACTIQLLCFFFFAVMTLDPNSSTFYGDDQYPAGQTSANHDTDALEHGSSFTLPVISLVVITILNDGTIITIAHDKVIPHKAPQKWDLREVVIVSTVLGLVPCISSMVLLVLGMQSNYSNQGTFIGKVMGQHGHEYLTWSDCMTMMYLKISLSDFLTVFSARTRGFFFDRRPGYALACAFVFATSCSTILSLFWDKIFVPKDNAALSMTGLAGGWAPLTVWIYNLIWFIAQDVIKVILYAMLKRVRNTEDDALKGVGTHAMLARMLESEDRESRLKGGPGMRRESSLMIGGGRSSEVTVLKDKVSKLEKELAELKRLVVERK